MMPLCIVLIGLPHLSLSCITDTSVVDETPGISLTENKAVHLKTRPQ